jgi:hypothetical protein
MLQRLHSFSAALTPSKNSNLPSLSACPPAWPAGYTTALLQGGNTAITERNTGQLAAS